MQRFILVRVVQGAITLLVISIIVFLLARAIGNPLDLLMPVEAAAEDYANLAKSLGLDKPLINQYLVYLNNAVHGDLGISFRTKRPVVEVILDRLPNSISLAGFSMAMALLIAIPLGVVAALKRGSIWDTAARAVAVLGQSVPTFWLGIVLVLIFSVNLHWLPTSGANGPLHFVMPGVTLGWYVAAGIVRLLRSSMLEILDSEYLKLARIKGVSEPRVVWVHALRNALIPVVTFAGFYFAILIGAAVVVETVFQWPGIGRLAYEAVMWRDFPLIQGVVLTVAAVVIVINLAVDILYAYIDPRIRY